MGLLTRTRFCGGPSATASCEHWTDAGSNGKDERSQWIGCFDRSKRAVAASSSARVCSGSILRGLRSAIFDEVDLSKTNEDLIALSLTKSMPGVGFGAARTYKNLQYGAGYSGVRRRPEVRR
jgi:hypothetical protein